MNFGTFVVSGFLLFLILKLNFGFILYLTMLSAYVYLKLYPLIVFLAIVLPVFGDGKCPAGYTDDCFFRSQFTPRILDFFNYQVTHQINYMYVKNASLSLPYFDSNCAQLVHYNSFVSLGCSLPRYCGKTLFLSQPVSFLESLMGQKTLLCYGNMFPVRKLGDFAVYNMTYHPVRAYGPKSGFGPIIASIDTEGVIDAFVLLYSPHLGYRVVTKICLEALLHFTNSTDISVTVDGDVATFTSDPIYPSPVVCPDYLGFESDTFFYKSRYDALLDIPWRAKHRWLSDRISECLPVPVSYTSCGQCFTQSTDHLLLFTWPGTFQHYQPQSVIRCNDVDCSQPKQLPLYQPLKASCSLTEVYVTASQVLRNLLIDVVASLASISVESFQTIFPIFLEVMKSVFLALINNFLFLLISLQITEYFLLYPPLYLYYRDHWVCIFLLFIAFVIKQTLNF